MSIEDAANQALDLQNASNLSGVAHTLWEILSYGLWPEAQRLGQGTEWVNTHPITKLVISKLVDLSEYTDAKYGANYCDVKALANR
jgi:hypothetical protein